MIVRSQQESRRKDGKVMDGIKHFLAGGMKVEETLAGFLTQLEATAPEKTHAWLS